MRLWLFMALARPDVEQPVWRLAEAKQPHLPWIVPDAP
jgi:hypothetical protein